MTERDDAVCPVCGASPVEVVPQKYGFPKVRYAAEREGLDVERLAYERGQRETLERMRAMRIDYRTMPHAEFPTKWPDWRDYEEVLPSACGCKDCRLWRSGS